MKNMKKFNLLLLATLVVFGSIFTFCKSSEPGTVTVTLDAPSFSSGATVTGTITSTNALGSVTLLLNGTTVVGWPITSFAAGQPVVGANSPYAIKITDLVSGSYTITATDKNGVQSSKTFIVQVPSPSLGKLTEVSASTTIFCTLADGSTNSTCASIDGTTYAPQNATTAQQTKIDFVYFNDGTNATIYAPDAIPAVINTTTSGFANWVIKNGTAFIKANGIVNYATATAYDVTSLSTPYASENLVVGDVIVFNTAGGKKGIFKVNSITGTDLATANINISIKVVE